MSKEIPTTPVRREVIDDNARKFIAAPINPEFLHDHRKKLYDMTVDWISVDEAAGTETKIVRKTIIGGDNDGKVEILLISKVTNAATGDRQTHKEPISEEDHREILARHTPLHHLDKRRHELEYQSLTLKYDEFLDGDFCMLEVESDAREEMDAFDPQLFPSALQEVSSDKQYTGWRMAETLARIQQEQA